MFTGIITNIAKVKRVQKTDEGLLITFEKPAGWADLVEGESVSTDGVCLTVAEIRANEYKCLLIPETLAKSSFGQKVPKSVNLERSLSLSDRLGGHFVQGHVDTTAKVTKIKRGEEIEFYIDLPKRFKNLVVQKGSIAINGVSLTVAGIQNNGFSVALIPHTLTHTTLGNLKENDLVNVEFDIIGKYILRNIEDAAS